MNAQRHPEDERPPFAASSIQPDVDLDANTSVTGNKLAVGLRLDEYEISGVLGEGGFGIVYLAWDHSLQRRLAIKEYFPASLAWRARDTQVEVKSPRFTESFEAGRRSFINEAKLLAGFDHPSLVKVHRFFQANGTAYMVMPYYEGITLRDALAASREPPDERWLRDLLAPLLAALEYMHAVNCYHRDIAPDNILLIDEGRPLLLDFGAARRVIGDMTQAVTVILKPGYAPIEQYGDMPGVGQGAWTDLYALGAVLHFAMTGSVPRASVTRVMADDYQPLAERLAGRYSPALLKAVDRMLMLRPQDRPQTVGELRAMIGIEASQDSGRIVLAPRVAPGAEPWTRPRATGPGAAEPRPAAAAPAPAPAAGAAQPAAARPGPDTARAVAAPGPKPMPTLPQRRARPTWAVLAVAGLGLGLLLWGVWTATDPAALREHTPAAAMPPADAPTPVPTAAGTGRDTPATTAAGTDPADRPDRAVTASPPEAAALSAAVAPSAPAPVAVAASAALPAPTPLATAPASSPASAALAAAAPTATPATVSPAPRAPTVATTPATTSATTPATTPATAPTVAAAAPRRSPPPAARPAAREPVAAPVTSPGAAPRIVGSARCADIIQRVSIGEALTAADRRTLKEECGK